MVYRGGVRNRARAEGGGPTESVSRKKAEERALGLGKTREEDAHVASGLHAS